LIDRLPHVRVISNFCVGIDKIDVAYAKARGIAVGYTPDVLNDCVADTAMLLLLDVARGGSAADRFVRRGDWLKGSFPLATRVSGKRLGILGLGGSAARSHPRCRLRHADPLSQPAGGSRFPYGYAASLLELAQWADFLVVASAGGAQPGLSAEISMRSGPRASWSTLPAAPWSTSGRWSRPYRKNGLPAPAWTCMKTNECPARAVALDNVVLLPHVATHETRQPWPIWCWTTSRRSFRAAR
jgi:lactate dehydrogenase-like 2-hydroxyacid dehydrogenase